MNAKKGYLEHTAVKVSDLDKAMEFFAEVFGMEVRDGSKLDAEPRQVWLWGGVQLAEDRSLDPDAAEPRFMHLGIMVEDLEDALNKAYARGVTQLPQGRNWVRTPCGLNIEIMQACNTSVRDALAIDPRREG